jgi:photosystem II stability/assembly factor-like uncharacterized protein
MKTLVVFLTISSCIYPQWVKVSQDSSITGTSWNFDSNQSKIYAAGYNLYVSTNEGTDWTDVILPGYFNGYVNDVDVNENWIYVGTGMGFHFSSDNGNTWFRSGTFTQNIRNLASHSNFILASVFASGLLYRSTDYGYTWAQLSPLPGSPYDIEDIYEHNGNFYVGTYEKGIYFSTNNGDSWIRITEGGVSGQGQTIRTFSSSDSLIYSGGVYTFKSTDSGYSWQKLFNAPIFPIQIVANNNLIFTASNGVFMSEDYGQNWVDVSYGLPDSCICSGIFLTDEYIITAIQLGGIWRRNLSEITSVKNEDMHLNSYELSQNFPNPFNPSTKIKYSIPKSDIVQIKVYDILGKEIRTLLNVYKQAGTYEVVFDASDLTSGVYFYKIISGSYVETKKMIMLR